MNLCRFKGLQLLRSLIFYVMLHGAIFNATGEKFSSCKQGARTIHCKFFSYLSSEVRDTALPKQNAALTVVRALVCVKTCIIG